jgi:uncharacterized OsmC-like protein
MNVPAIPEGLSPDVRKRVIRIEAETENVDNMVHEAHVGKFTFRSDEPPELSGYDSQPYPLDYMTASLGMCLLTQVVRYSRMLKIDIKKARVAVTADWTVTGSVFAGTIAATCHGMQTDLEVESDADDHLVAAVLRNAEQGCFARAAIEQPVPLKTSARVNGRVFDYESYPRRVSRRLTEA